MFFDNNLDFYKYYRTNITYMDDKYFIRGNYDIKYTLDSYYFESDSRFSMLIDFWASWCVPCRIENPHVVIAYQQFKNKNFTVLGISFDNPGQHNRWIEAIHADNLSWTQVSDLKGCLPHPL